MTLTQLFRSELEHEAKTTRRHLERLPDEHFAWRPHVKSFTAGGLASHIVTCVSLAETVLGSEELDVDPAAYQPYRAGSARELLEAFDRHVARGLELLAATNDEGLATPWRLKFRGVLRFERPRAVVFRDFTLSHLVHHRGQFTVYLRLLDIPVPGSYGPTADERF
jgi:uncharacterized damage-inducible protein DinB